MFFLVSGGSDSDQETEESWAEEDRLSSPVLHNRKRRRGVGRINIVSEEERGRDN